MTTSSRHWLGACPARTFAGPPQVELIDSIADTAERAIDPSGDGPLRVAQVGFERAGLALRGIDAESPLGLSADYAFLEYVIGVEVHTISRDSAESVASCRRRCMTSVSSGGTTLAALVAAGYEVFGVNPLPVSRYRERHGPSGAKSDRADAHTLADMVRTDAHQHAPGRR